MKKRILSTLVAFIITFSSISTAFANTMYDHSQLFSFEIGNQFLYENTDWGFSNGLLNIIKEVSTGSYKYGYVNTSGKTIIDFVFDEAEPFSEGYAVVCQYINGRPKYGYVNTSGSLVVPCIYDYAKKFSEGLAAVGNYDSNNLIKCGFINSSGSIVVPLIYDSAYYFSNGLAEVSIDSDGDGYGEFGYIDKSGSIKVPFDYTYACPFADNGYAAVSKEVNEDGLVQWGFIDSSNKALTLFIYDFAFDFSEGLASVGIYTANSSLGTSKVCGFLDEYGREIIELQYDSTSSLKDSLIMVSKNEKVGYINSLNQFIIPLSYTYGTSFQEGLAAVSAGGKIGYIDSTGKNITPFIYDKASLFSEGYATVVYDGKTQVIQHPYDAITYSEVLAEPTSSTILVNGVAMQFEAYKINDNNYFKLRDLAYISSGTSKQFEVTWNNSTSSIDLISGSSYTVVGGEMATGDMLTKIGKQNSSALYINGTRVNISAFTINGNNFFKLRDICEVFDIGVTWDNASKTIGIDHNISYTN